MLVNFETAQDITIISDPMLDALGSTDRKDQGVEVLELSSFDSQFLGIPIEHAPSALSDRCGILRESLELGQRLRQLWQNRIARQQTDPVSAEMLHKC